MLISQICRILILTEVFKSELENNLMSLRELSVLACLASQMVILIEGELIDLSHTMIESFIEKFLSILQVIFKCTSYPC